MQPPELALTSAFVAHPTLFSDRFTLFFPAELWDYQQIAILPFDTEARAVRIQHSHLLSKSKQFPYQNQWNYSEGSKLIRQEEKKKSGTFKAEITTDSLSVSEENIFTAVNKQSLLKEPAPETTKAIASSLSPKPSV